MQKFTLKILAFILLLFLAIILWPVSKQRIYKGLENDCYGYAGWMYDRIHINPEPVDIAFVGSSHTINGIEDKLIEEKLSDLHILNFGYCRPGRNLDFLMVRELIENKHPKTIILEVREYDNPYSHPIFPYLAENRDLISLYPFFNPDWFSDISLATQYRLQLIQESIWHGTSEYFYDKRKHGRIPYTDTANAEILNARIEGNNSKYKPSESKRQFDHTFPHHYLEKIVTLCKESNTALTFLYIPSYGSKEQYPYPLEYLESFAPIWIPPTSIWENQDFWYDAGHLNQSGAIKLSEWVTKKLRQEPSLVLNHDHTTLQLQDES